MCVGEGVHPQVQFGRNNLHRGENGRGSRGNTRPANYRQVEAAGPAEVPDKKGMVAVGSSVEIFIELRFSSRIHDNLSNPQTPWNLYLFNFLSL